MVFSAGLPDFVREHEPLARYTSLGVGGPARWLARPRTVEQLMDLVRRCRQEDVELQVLGRGANLLVSDDGVDGVVVRLNAPEFRQVDWAHDAGPEARSGAGRRRRRRGGDSGEVVITAGGGADMSRLVLEAVRRGLSGLECMAGIPGTLGGIIHMNGGGRFGEIADVVRDATVVDSDGQLRTLSRDEVGFRYRGANLGEAIVCRATLALRPGDPTEIRERFLEVWDYKKKSQPLAESTAGCVFKNPPGHSAGALIDRAGLKNRSVGGAEVSDCHANFIVAKEGATARDVLALIGIIRREVARRFGIDLELEIEVWHRRRVPFEKLEVGSQK